VNLRKYVCIALRNDSLADISLAVSMIKKIKKTEHREAVFWSIFTQTCVDHKILIFSPPFSAILECRIHIAEWEDYRYY
jgi:hypothetical protein